MKISQKAKRKWVRKKIYSCSVRSDDFYDGVFYIYSTGKVMSYHNGGDIDENLAQLRDRAKRMSFDRAFWFLKKKAKEINLKFRYEELL